MSAVNAPRLLVFVFTVSAAGCGGKLVGDPGKSDASLDTGSDEATVAVCGAFDSDAAQGPNYGTCPAGWHCEVVKRIDGVWNVCCPPGQTGSSDQCINPQN